MMLDHLNEKPAAERLMQAVEAVTADPDLHTPDLGGKATTRIVTDADVIIGALAQAPPVPGEVGDGRKVVMAHGHRHAVARALLSNVSSNIWRRVRKARHGGRGALAFAAPVVYLRRESDRGRGGSR